MKMIRLLFVMLAFIAVQHYSYSQAAPTLLLPTNNNNCQSLSVDLEWEETSGALSYIVQISEDADFSEYYINQPGLTSPELTVILNNWGKRYWWRVTAVYSGGGMGTSTHFSFYTKAAPVMLESPVNALACTDLSMQFKWFANDAEFYDIRIATDAEFTNIAYSKTNIMDTTITIKLPNYQTTYYWQVSSLKGTCKSEWSDVRTFTTKTALPIQQYPGNLTYGSEIFISDPYYLFLNWKAVEGAESYLLQISTDPTFAEMELDTADLTDTTVYFLIGPVYNTVYYWRIAVVVDGCRSDWTNNFSFKTPYQATNLISPLNDGICVSLTSNEFKWTSVASASRYRLQISDSDDFENVLFDIEDIDKTEISVKLDLPLTEHFWRVKPEDQNNDGLWSQIRKFKTTQKGPNFVNPINGAVGLQMVVKLEWEDLGESNRYDVRVSADPSFATKLIDTSLNDNSLTIILPDNNTVYYWQVRAIIGVCIGDWSETYTFKTLIQPPVLLKPENFASKVSVYPIFSWEDVDDALLYQIRVSKDSLFAVIYKTMNDIDAISFTFAGEEFEEETTYYWQVRAKNDDGISLWSEMFRFSTGTKPAAPPTLLLPTNTAIKVALDVDLVWESRADADSYRIQVALDRDFVSIVADSMILDTNMSMAAFSERYTNFYWRVASINKGGQGLWSGYFSYRTKDIAPEDQATLTFPTNNAEGLGNFFTFQWEEVERALGYELEISTTNNFADGTVIYSNESIWQNSKLVYDLPYNTRMWWRLRAWNEDGKAPWSNTWSFTTLDPTSVEESLYNSNTYTYPNPAVDATYIIFEMNKDANANIKIINMLGHEIERVNNFMAQSGENRLQVNTANLVPGIYLFIIEYDGGRINGRFVVNK